MKAKAFAFITALLSTAMIMTACKKAESDKTETIKKRGYFIVGLDDQFPPMGFRDSKTNEIVGFDIDLARETAKRMGLKLQLKPVEWDSIILSLNKGDIDLIWNGLTITEERQKRIAFSPAYLDNHQIVVVKTDSKVQSLKDLSGKVVGLQLGSSSEKALDRNKSFSQSLKELRKFDNNTMALMDLGAGRIDAVVVDEIVGRYYLSKKPGTYRVLKENLGSELYGIGMRQGDVKFQNMISDAMNAIKNDGTGRAISKKWFNEDILKK